jgi:hypothetical protein
VVGPNSFSWKDIEVKPMKSPHSNAETADHTKHAKGSERKPFEAPALRREAALTEATAERMFTFGGGGGS